MVLTVNNNYSAAIALQNLNVTNRSLEQTQTRINTGQKVSTAKDDAAIYAISELQKGEVSGFTSVRTAISNGESIVGVALDAGKQITSIVNEMMKKTVQAQDQTLTTAQRAAINTDYQALYAQIFNIVNNAQFNGQNLIGTSAATINVIVNTNGDSITVTARTLTPTAIGLPASIGPNDTAAGASAAVTMVRSALGTTASRLGNLGANARSLEAQNAFTKSLIDAVTHSISNLIDADLAEESAKLQALQIKQQLGVQALSIANSAPQVILSLFRS
ncbi:flagellin [Zavarzinia sp. CC-PAN008]|uniref:flagellin n=1 Tax=Zavarzinia sp. CC-PAN008 TaxID=3243332 RepID=UPI003F7469D7